MRLILAAAVMVAVALSAPAQPLTRVSAHDGILFAMASRPGGREIATGGFDRTIKLWTVDGDLRATLRGHGAPLSALGWSPDSATLISGDTDGRLLLWHPEQSQSPKRLEGHPSCVYAIAFFPDGRTFFTCGQDHRVRVWSATGELLKTFGPFATPLYALSLSPDAQTFAVAGKDGRILICDSQSGELKRTLEAHAGPVLTLAHSPDGRWLASGGEDKVVRIWDADAGREVRRLAGHGDPVTHVEYAASGRRLFTLSEGGLAVVWDSTTGEALFAYRFPGATHCGAKLPGAIAVGLDSGTWMRFELPANCR